MVVDSTGPPSDHRNRPRRRSKRIRRQTATDIFWAFHFACDIGESDIAAQLLYVLEKLSADRVHLSAEEGKRELALLAAAHERLLTVRRT
jgi:hypothetical protein